jgi:hypothetical protein
MPSRSRTGIYANPSQDFAKLIKMQSPFVKPLDRSFIDFFAKTGMQSPFAKLLELLLHGLHWNLWGPQIIRDINERNQNDIFTNS